MRIHKYIIVITCCIFIYTSQFSFGQSKEDCLKEVLSIEEKMNLSSDTNTFHKNIFLSYSVRAADWDDQVIVSNVKVYKKENNIHMFSEQANLYQDDNEVVIILPQQKLVVINSTDKKTTSSRLSSDFFLLRKSFIDSCEVVKCEINGNVKKLELKVNRAPAGVFINKIIYNYNFIDKRIDLVSLSYNSNYKLKNVQISYKEISLNSEYKYDDAKRYIFSKSGKVLPKFSNYELVDNRDKKKKKSK